MSSNVCSGLIPNYFLQERLNLVDRAIKKWDSVNFQFNHNQNVRVFGKAVADQFSPDLLKIIGSYTWEIDKRTYDEVAAYLKEGARILSKHQHFPIPEWKHATRRLPPINAEGLTLKGIASPGLKDRYVWFSPEIISGEGPDVICFDTALVNGLARIGFKSPTEPMIGMPCINLNVPLSLIACVVYSDNKNSSQIEAIKKLGIRVFRKDVFMRIHNILDACKYSPTD